MCFCLYLATASEPPLIPCQGSQPGTGKISTSRRRVEQSLVIRDALRKKVTLPCITELVSDGGCGCAFRSQGPGDVSSTQPYHVSLVAFLAEHCGKESFVELYGCWCEDEARETQERHEIELSELADEAFYFEISAYYRVRMLG